MGRQGASVAALNFASAKKPRRWFPDRCSGAGESLARASGLYAMLLGDPMYDHQTIPQGSDVHDLGDL